MPNQADLFQLSTDPAGALERLIQDILLGRSGPWAPSDKERAFLHIIRWHKGAEHAIELRVVTEKLRLPAREVKALVKTMVEDFGLAIGARRQEPYGYFLCVTADDVEQAIRPLEKEIISLARRVRALGGEHRLAEFAGQLQLKVEQKESAA